MMKALFSILSTLALALGGCSGSGGECKQDTDCPPGRFCDLEASACIFQCTFDADCRADQICTARGRCESGCRATNGGIEDCDGQDNDCDGQTDEELEVTDCQAENQHGLCTGERTCQGGAWVCDAAWPEPELCDGVDNDCDGETDEELADRACPLNQGVCAGAAQICQGAEGFSECDYGPDHQPGVEASCDGLDNDCDGETDEGLGTLSCPLTLGLCAAEVQVCQGTDGWSECDYGPDYEPDVETRCDGQDNDCDGATDEQLAPDYTVCEVGPMAVDGLDNNCDGLTDEPGGCVIKIPGSQVWIDVYEASVYENQYCSGARYGMVSDDYPGYFFDTDEQPSLVELFACSMPDERPSRYLTFYQARRTCQALGKRLCTKQEWAQACGGDAQLEHPYGDPFELGTCGDHSVAPDTLPAGDLDGCISPVGAMDMVGNVWEWVADTCNWDAEKASLQGGSYRCEYCDAQDNCSGCDYDNPEHMDYIESRYRCHHPDQPWWCVAPDVEGSSYGVRCCWDGP